MKSDFVLKGERFNEMMKARNERFRGSAKRFGEEEYTPNLLPEEEIDVVGLSPKPDRASFSDDIRPVSPRLYEDRTDANEVVRDKSTPTIDTTGRYLVNPVTVVNKVGLIPEDTRYYHQPSWHPSVPPVNVPYGMGYEYGSSLHDQEYAKRRYGKVSVIINSQSERMNPSSRLDYDQQYVGPTEEYAVASEYSINVSSHQEKYARCSNYGKKPEYGDITIEEIGKIPPSYPLPRLVVEHLQYPTAPHPSLKRRYYDEHPLPKRKANENVSGSVHVPSGQQSIVGHPETPLSKMAEYCNRESSRSGRPDAEKLPEHEASPGKAHNWPLSQADKQLADKSNNMLEERPRDGRHRRQEARRNTSPKQIVDEPPVQTVPLAVDEVYPKDLLEEADKNDGLYSSDDGKYARCSNHGKTSEGKKLSKNRPTVDVVSGSESNTCSPYPIDDQLKQEINNKIGDHPTTVSNPPPANVDDKSRSHQNSSPVAGNAQNQSGEKKRDPKCARCRNHEKTSRLKGHKNDCPFRNCRCEKCILVLKRQEVNAKTVALNRKLEEPYPRPEKMYLDRSSSPSSDPVLVPPRSTLATPHESIYEEQSRQLEDDDDEDEGVCEDLVSSPFDVNENSSGSSVVLRQVEVQQNPRPTEQKSKNPKCTRCRYHGIITPVKNHKRYCKFRNCICDKCILVVERQKVMAAQVAVRRAQAQDEEMKKTRKPEVLPGAADVQPSPCIPSVDPSSSSAFQPIKGSVNQTVKLEDLSHLQESISKIAAHFVQPHATFIYAAYIALLRDNKFDHNKVIQKLTEGDNLGRQLGLTARMQPTIPSPPPSSFISSSPAATQSLLSAASFHPSLSCYSPYNYPLPYHASGFSLGSSAAAHPGLETTGPAVYSSFHPYLPTPPYSLSSSAVVPLSSEGAASHFTPPHRLGDGHTSGDSRGSTELKDESDKEGGGNVRVETSTPGSAVVSPVNAIVAAHRRSRSSRPYHIYNMPFPDRRETAANA